MSGVENTWSDAQMKYSYETVLHTAFFNFLVFPVSGLLWKYRYGFQTGYDIALWIVGTFWQGSMWGIFLIIFLTSPASITLAWVPYLMTSIVVWPLSYLAYSMQDEKSEIDFAQSKYRQSSQ